MHIVILAAAAAALALLPGAAPAATLFSEDFQSVTGGTTNFGAGQRVGQFTVIRNDVDVFGTPITAYVCGASGNTCLDLNGNAAGTIRSDMLAIIPGTLYTVSFDLAGNGPPSYPSATYPYTLEVDFAGVTKSFSVAPLAAFTTRSFDVTATSLRSMLTFTSTSSANPSYWGPVLDNIRITSADPIGGVPEPAAWGMMVAGFGLVGASLRRSRAPDALRAAASYGGL